MFQFRGTDLDVIGNFVDFPFETAGRAGRLFFFKSLIISKGSLLSLRKLCGCIDRTAGCGAADRV